MLSQHASSLLVLAGVGVAVYLLLRSSRSGRESPPAAGRRALPKPAVSAPLAETPPDVLRWQVEMHETARELKAEIDTKLAALQALAILAQQESQRLEAALARACDVESAAPRYTLAAIEGLGDAAALDDPGQLSHVAAQIAPPRGLRGKLFDDNRDRVAIAQLAAQGLAAPEIARRLSLPLGDVELLLNLRSA